MSLDLNYVEKCYLSCLLNGADDAGIEIRGYVNHTIYDTIKLMRDNGYEGKIPDGVITGTMSVNFPNEPARNVEKWAALIRDEQKKLAIRGAADRIGKNVPVDTVMGSLQEELDKLAEKSGMTRYVTADQLERMDFENTEFIIDRLLPVGLTLFMGAPKMRKSFMMLDWAFEIASGGGIFDYRVRRVPVLYYTLEDNLGRCKHRLNDMFGEAMRENPPKNLVFCEHVDNSLEVVNGIKKTGARVVIIDTFARFASVQDGNDYYEMTRKTSELKRIADTLKVALIVVHHVRKDSGKSEDWTNDAMGSQGLVGAADAIIGLEKKRDENDAKLKLTGRDIKDLSLNLHWNDETTHWDIVHE
jgi:RecA-family ATPase